MQRILSLSVLAGVFAVGTFVIARQANDPAQQQMAPDLGKLLSDVKSADDNTKVAALMALADFGPKAEPAIADLIALMQSKNEDLRLNAAILLGKIGKAAVPSVTKLLIAEDEDTRFYAISTLAWIGPDAQETAPLIVKALSDKSDSVRRKAAYALGQVAPGEKSSIPLLIDILGDANDDVRGAATDALGKFGSSAVSPLIDALKEKKTPKSVGAARALAEIGSAANEAIPVLKEWLYEKEDVWQHEAQDALSKIGKASIGVLVEAIKDANEATRFAAISALGKIGADAVPDLVDAMGSKYVQVRRIAVQHLINMGVSDKMVVLAFAYGLKDEDREVHLGCMHGLLMMGPAGGAAASVLIDIMQNDPDPNSKQHAMRTLQSVGGDPKVVLPALKKMLADGDSSARLLAVEVVWKFGNESLQLIIERLDDKDQSVRRQAAWSLHKLPPDKALLPHIRQMLKHKDAEVRQVAVQMLVRSPDAAADELVPYLKDSDVNIRWQAFHTLQRDKSHEKLIAPALSEIINDKTQTKESQEFAIYAMTQLGPDSWPNLFEALKMEIDPQVRANVIAQLGNFGEKSKEALPVLIDGLKHDHVFVRLSATQALQVMGIHAQAALPALRELLNDPEPAVCVAAKVALNAIEGK